MKKYVVAALVMLMYSQAHATPLVDVDVNAGAKAFAGAASFAQGGQGGLGGSVGNTTLSVNTEAADYGDLRIVPPAIAPNITTSVICPMVMQGSKAGSMFFFSGSGTHAPDIVPICVAWHLGQGHVVERLACQASKAYRDANPAYIHEDGTTRGCQ